VKRILFGTSVLVSLALAWGGVAGGQEDPTTTTTESPTTTEPPPPTSTTIPQPDELPGEYVTAGTLRVGASFRDEVASNCYVEGPIGGAEMNIVKGDTGNIGALYGRANLGGDVGIVMIQLGPLPMAVTAFRTTGQCNQDVVGIGGYESTPTSATLNAAVGYGLYPNDYAENVTVELNVSGTAPGGNLNLQGAYDFLMEPRPPAPPR
jgi:hypothetical protein